MSASSLHHSGSSFLNESARQTRFPEVRTREEGLSTRHRWTAAVTQSAAGEENLRLPEAGYTLGCSGVVEQERREDGRLIWWRAMAGVKLVTVATE